MGVTRRDTSSLDYSDICTYATVIVEKLGLVSMGASERVEVSAGS